MNITLTPAQLDQIKEEKAKKEKILEKIPKAICGWERIYLEDYIRVLSEIIERGTMGVYSVSP